MKADPLHAICLKNGEGSEDPDKKQKGCPTDTILDAKEGPQKIDADTKDLKCAIDDTKDCKPPKVSETRPDGKENDSNFKPRCLDVDENDKTKCDEKHQYTEVTTGPDGKAKRKCKPTRQYQNKKKSRMQKSKDKFKKAWEDRKEQRAKKEEERNARKAKIEEEYKEKQRKLDEEKKKQEEEKKKQEQEKKKRVKSYKCGMASVIVAGQQIAGLIPTKKRGLEKRGNADIESYMDMSACYFDADFVEDDGFLEYWPSDINIDDVGDGVDEDAYMKAFMERMDHLDLKYWNTHDFCKRNENGTVEARCQRKKRDELLVKEKEYEKRRKRVENALKRDITKTTVAKREEEEESLSGEEFCDMTGAGKREEHGVETIEKRNPFAIFIEIGLSAARMAGSLLSRAIPHISRFSPRLASLLANSSKNLFKLAPKGSGTAGSREAMKTAFRKLADHPAFKKCIRDGRPT
ncbi:hypothetical protein K458DRAFT_433343 [Lentithecium fluviatile CBS 122367]|uniref:Uncharacterized protein n=1 Tax=Lentithecium fluviatile CBS 122367 TaxID=1168545 RepID=A0A6G1IVI1_9PLEO|nr:hypothetical protein K458DRAFT_433343 [Lentithecium fluviatile CBS 122367]